MPAEMEILSPVARKLVEADADAYRKLIVTGGTPPAARRLLEGVGPEQLLTVPIAAPAYADALRAALWLWHDGLDECHVVAQQEPRGMPELAGTLNFLHAILHRREGDFWNSKYWYARCRNHPALETVATWAEPVLAASPGTPLGSGWQPDAFVDWVEALHRRPDPAAEELAVKLQRVEWQALFAFCAREAAGR